MIDTAWKIGVWFTSVPELFSWELAQLLQIKSNSILMYHQIKKSEALNVIYFLSKKQNKQI